MNVADVEVVEVPLVGLNVWNLKLFHKEIVKGIGDRHYQRAFEALIWAIWAKELAGFAYR